MQAKHRLTYFLKSSQHRCSFWISYDCRNVFNTADATRQGLHPMSGPLCSSMWLSYHLSGPSMRVTHFIQKDLSFADKHEHFPWPFGVACLRLSKIDYREPPTSHTTPATCLKTSTDFEYCGLERHAYSLIQSHLRDIHKYCSIPPVSSSS